MADMVPVGPLLDELGVRGELEDQDRITEVLVIAKVLNLGSGHVGLLVASNDLDWIAQAGLHAAFTQVLDAPERGTTEDQD